LRYSIKKSEILRSKKKIQELFEEGSSFFLYPFKVFFVRTKTDKQKIEVLFSVSKKNFGKAVDRNKIRRRMREAYRLNKGDFLGDIQSEVSISLAIIYIGRLKLPYTEIENKLKAVFLRLLKTTDNQENNL
jgi:ribonuclease P protein component